VAAHTDDGESGISGEQKKWIFASKRTKSSGKKQRTKDVAKKVVG
jgi:hypothetical protein